MYCCWWLYWIVVDGNKWWIVIVGLMYVENAKAFEKRVRKAWKLPDKAYRMDGGSVVVYGVCMQFVCYSPQNVIAL